MLTPKERLKTEDRHMENNSVQVTKVAKTSAINHFEQVMNAPLIKAKTEKPMSRHKLSDGTNPEKNKRPSLVTEEPSKSAEHISPDQISLNEHAALSKSLSPQVQSATHRITATVEAKDSKQPSSSNPIQELGFTQHPMSTLGQLHSKEPIKGEASISDNTASVSTTHGQASSQALFVQAEKPSRSNSELSSTPLMTKPSRHVDNAPVLSSGSKMLKAEKSQEEPHIQHHISAQQNNTPGQIILANLKTPEPMNQQFHNLVSQLVDKVQILVPNLGNQNRVQLVLEQGQLKGTEITITLQNNQLNVTLSHSNQHTELLKQLRPELLERLQKMNTDQQVRVITTSHEQAAQNGHQEQGQHESSQKSRVFDLWLEEQENA